MDRIQNKLAFAVFGLIFIHTVNGQAGGATNAVADPLDPALAAAAQEVVTQPPVAAPVTTPAPVPQESTLIPETSTQVNTAPTEVVNVPPPVALAAAITDPGIASPNIRTDVTDTVMALLNETGYSGSANDANVQEIVAMLMNGTVPTDADLIRLGFIPQPAIVLLTTPPPYSIPGQPPVDPSLSFPPGNVVIGAQTSGGSQTGVSGSVFPTVGGPPLLGPSSGPQPTGTGTGAATDPFGPAFASIGGTAGTLPNFQTLVNGVVTSPKPVLGDPFSVNAVAGPSAGQIGVNLGPIDPNALGPKPFPNMGPVGGLGTPGSTTDLLGNLGPMPGGMMPLPPQQTSILETQYNQQQQGGGMNPMMMMMMMNPELMDQMMSGENPMLTMMMMQQFMRRPAPRPRPSLPLGLGPMAGFPGGFPGGMPAAGMPMLPPGPGMPPMGGGGLMDIMGAAGLPLPPLGAPGASPIDPAALPGLGAGALPLTQVAGPGAPPIDLAALGAGAGAVLPPTLGGAAVGSTPMDLIQGSLATPVGTGAGPADMSPFLNMISTGAAGAAPAPLPGAAPPIDPFPATVG